MTVRELLARMSSLEFSEWLAEDKLRAEDAMRQGLADDAVAGVATRKKKRSRR